MVNAQAFAANPRPIANEDEEVYYANIHFDKRVRRGSNYSRPDVAPRQATAEDMPFEDESFEGACSLFSFRDWYDKRAGLIEVKRVLKPGGRLVIVDPAKMNRVHGWLGYMWMRVWVGAYARYICKMSDHPWKWLTKTYVHFGTTKDYVKMLKECGFTDVKAKVVFPGMATIWTAKKPE